MLRRLLRIFTAAAFLIGGSGAVQAEIPDESARPKSQSNTGTPQPQTGPPQLEAGTTQAGTGSGPTKEPPSDPPGGTVLWDQAYSETDAERRVCDVYLPDGRAAEGGRPAIVIIHGGGWTVGDKWTMSGYSRSLAEAGYVTININYRLAPQHQFPAQVDDVRQALIWTVQNAKRFSVDTKRLALCGYSAGGHLSALVGVLGDEPLDVQRKASDWPINDPRWNQLPRVVAVCAGGAPCDFRDLPPENEMLAYFLGGSRAEKPQAYQAASPTAHASAGDPETQIIHGEEDVLVPIATSRNFHQALLGQGVDSRFQTIEDRGHLLTFLHPETKLTLMDFFRETLGSPKPLQDGAVKAPVTSPTTADTLRGK